MAATALDVAPAGLLGGASAAVAAGDPRSAAVGAAFRGGGCALAAVVVLALAWHPGRATAARR